MQRHHTVAAVLVAFGVALHTYTHFVEAESFSLSFWSWSISPYVVGGVLLVSTSRYILVGALALVAIADFFTFRSVFFWPTNSTAGLNLLFMPLWNFLIMLPLGGVLGWLLGKGVQQRAR